MTGWTLLIVFCLVPSVIVVIMAIIEAPRAVARKRRIKRERVFKELRLAGYDICDVNSNATRAKLRVMDPYDETPTLVWCDIVDLGGSYGLGEPINNLQN